MGGQGQAEWDRREPDRPPRAGRSVAGADVRPPIDRAGPPESIASAAQPASAADPLGGPAQESPPVCREKLIRERSDSAQRTEALGEGLAEGLRGGDVVLIAGDLGSGKTTLVRGIARALGVEANVTSPTFTIAQRYRGKRLDVSHLDLYRLADLGAEEPELLADYIDDGSVLLVEWPAAAAGALPEARLLIELSHAGGDSRALRVSERGREPGRQG